jgi:hypothetical protein
MVFTFIKYLTIMLIMLKMISRLLLITFTSMCFLNPLPSFAVSTTGTLKIFSEIKGIKVYVDEELKGTDVIEVKDLTPGAHYVKIMKDNDSLYSELVTVAAGVTSAILVKSSAAPAPSKPPLEVQQAVDKLYTQGQTYKQEKLDILMSKTTQTVGSATTTYNNFPGYFSWFDYSTTNLSSTQYEVTDWKIIQGGVQEISDRQLAELAGDKATIARMDKDWEDYNGLMGWGAFWGVTGLLMVVVGGAMAFQEGANVETGAVIFAVGFVPLIAGLGIVGKNPPSGHYVSPKAAAKQAFDYNQALKTKLGLPASYEPR